jgi:hypothetical protein
MRLRQCNNWFMAYVVGEDANPLSAAKLLVLSPYRRRSSALFVTREIRREGMHPRTNCWLGLRWSGLC